MHTTHLYYIIYNWAREGAELAGEHLNLCRHLPVALKKGVVWNNSNHTEIDTPKTLLVYLRKRHFGKREWVLNAKIYCLES